VVAGDSERWWQPKAHGGEGVVDLDDWREGWEQLRWSEVRSGCSFIGSRGWGGGGGAPLMAIDYRKTGRQRWPIKEGEGERAWPVRLPS
jgi:hypothetical protein